MHTKFEDVQKRYASGFVLDVDALEIEAGASVGLVGSNGAGKTTLLLVMLGLLRIERGDVRLDGESVRTFGLSWRSKTASHMGESSLLPFLRPWEYWQFVGDAYGIDRREQRRRLRAFDGFVELASGKRGRKKYIRDYSQGNRKKIGLAGAMMVRPRLLVLDEPFTHLDARSRAALAAMLTELNARHGTTLVVSSHELQNVMEVCRRSLLIERGRITFDEPSGPNTLRLVQGRLTGDRYRSQAVQTKGSGGRPTR